MVEVSCCNKNYIAWKVKNVYSPLTLNRESLLMIFVIDSSLPNPRTLIPFILHVCSNLLNLHPVCGCCSVAQSCRTLVTRAAHQAPLSIGFPGRTTGVGAIPSSRASSRPRGQTRVSFVGRRILYHRDTREPFPQRPGFTCQSPSG